ncbi:MAG: hypothetical protein OIN88_00515 [Candidatus Methanoperedens sp.]|nr:hypothetical protein [Candidatus Methanoperedens sp.]MCZ7359048.1 hypothetical protein [Candidatus Methanoperedens sp.]HLB70846.1 hypothetical protein [Candidatus Methanoperedens sp.]
MTKEMLAYEDTLKDIEKTFGAVPGLMKLFPDEKLVHDWPSWKRMGEIDMERVRFLLSTDEMIEEMLSETQGNIVPMSPKPDPAAEAAQEDSA